MSTVMNNLVHHASKRTDFFYVHSPTHHSKKTLKKSTVFPLPIGSTIIALSSTHCAWKSISTGSWLLMTLSVKSSLS